jgi:phytoene dehydrogenase-like protein
VKAVVVGGGQHGLAAAIVLAREGYQTTVVESRPTLGGLCAGEEFHPGYSHVGIHHDTELVRPALVRALDLEPRGVTLREAPAVFVPADSPERAGLLDAAELARVGEAAGWASFRAQLRAWSPAIASLLDDPVPPIGPGQPTLPLLRKAMDLRWLGGEALMELLRVGASSAEDWLSEHFADPRIRAALALPALLGSWSGPRSPQSAGLLLLREAVAGAEVVGGPAALIRALVDSARHQGVTLRAETRVESLLVRGGRAVGVRLAGGEELPADRVVSSLDPRRTLLSLLEAGALPVDAEDEIRRWRVRPVVAKVHLALTALPPSRSRPDLQPERWRVVGDVRELERAFDAAKHGRVASEPALDVRIPSLSVPGLAPGGHHVASILVFGVPGNLQGGWTAAARQALLDHTLRRLEADRPGLRSAVAGAEVLAPPDLEQRYGATGGHLMHGEHGLDQLWVGRPGPRFCRHHTPVPGLYLASGGTHPHGGASLAAGWLAGRAAAERR